MRQIWDFLRSVSVLNLILKILRNVLIGANLTQLGTNSDIPGAYVSWQQGCQIWDKLDQILTKCDKLMLDFFKTKTRICYFRSVSQNEQKSDLKKVPDLSYFGLFWPTLEPNQTPLGYEQRQALMSSTRRVPVPNGSKQKHVKWLFVFFR